RLLGLLRRRGLLPRSKLVSVGIAEVEEPADVGDLLLRSEDLAARRLDLLLGLLEAVDGRVVDDPGRDRHVTDGEEAAAAVLVAEIDERVLPAHLVFELPAEDRAVELLQAIAVLGAPLDVLDGILLAHDSSPMKTEGSSIHHRPYAVATSNIASARVPT